MSCPHKDPDRRGIWKAGYQRSTSSHWANARLAQETDQGLRATADRQTRYGKCLRRSSLVLLVGLLPPLTSAAPCVPFCHLRPPPKLCKHNRNDKGIAYIAEPQPNVLNRTSLMTCVSGSTLIWRRITSPHYFSSTVSTANILQEAEDMSGDVQLVRRPSLRQRKHRTCRAFRHFSAESNLPDQVSTSETMDEGLQCSAVVAYDRELSHDSSSEL